MCGDLCTASFSFVPYLAGLNDPTLLRLDVDTKLSDQLKVIQFWISLIVALEDIYETLPVVKQVSLHVLWTSIFVF